MQVTKQIRTDFLFLARTVAESFVIAPTCRLLSQKLQLYLSFSRKKKIQYIQKKGEKLKTEIEIEHHILFLFRYRKRSLSQQAEVSLITRPMYEGSSSRSVILWFYAATDNKTAKY